MQKRLSSILPMTKFTLDATKLTPFVSFEPNDGVLIIKGNSTADDVTVLYAKVIELLERYALNPCASTTVNVALDYITVNSSRELLDIFKLIENLHQQKKTEATINWYYKIEEMKNEGEMFQLLIQSPFNIVKQ
jgi:SiaC family regulatory phosphoprotein